jgi:hypothetical protein
MANLSKEALPPYPSINYYSLYIIKSDYNHAFNKIRLWALKSEEYHLTAATRIYHVKEYII